MNIKKLFTKCKEYEKRFQKNSTQFEKDIIVLVSENAGFERYIPVVYTIFNQMKVEHYDDALKFLTKHFNEITENQFLPTDVNIHEINRLINELVIPYFVDEFRVSDSREISFLPLELRLYLYNELHKQTKDPMTKIHIKDRLATTLNKMNKDVLAQKMFILKWLDNLLLLNQTKQENTTKFVQHELMADVLSMEKVIEQRKDILKQKKIQSDEAIYQLNSGISNFTSREMIQDVEAAKRLWPIFCEYFPLLAKQNNVVEAVERYFDSKDRSELNSLIGENKPFVEPTSVLIGEKNNKVTIKGTSKQKSNRKQVIQVLLENFEKVFEQDPVLIEKEIEIHLNFGRFREVLQLAEWLIEKDYAAGYSTKGYVLFAGPAKYKNVNEAISYLEKAMELGHPDAYRLLGEAYREGEGVPKNIKKALELFIVAAQKDSYIAQAALASLFSNGQYFERDLDKALQYAKQAAAHDYYLGHILSGFILLQTGVIPKSVAEEAMNHFRKAYQQNPKSEAAFYIALFYYNGIIPYKKDWQEAAKWFSIAKQNMDPEAAQYLKIIKAGQI
ncbi:tetratricopeptide repeat protein [Lysinibacillus fusiformis]|nr:tetratricopeptide repeat protein [Lysinibacillus fusiformis]